MGILTGTDGGKFDGGNTMTRAQACTVITRLLDAVGKGPTPEPVKPTTVEVKSTVTPYNGTYYEVADNGYPTGTLNNGKPITAENITEMMLEAQKLWPDGMVWAEREKGATNNWYQNSSATVSQALRTYPYNTSAQYACGAFSAMLSDYVFGKASNPMYRLTDLSNIRPGDIIFWANTPEKLGHVVIVVDTVKTGPYAGQLYIADGNNSDMVQWHDWPEILQNSDKPGAHWYSWALEDLSERGSFAVFSRWPQ